MAAAIRLELTDLREQERRQIRADGTTWSPPPPEAPAESDLEPAAIIGHEA